MALAERLYAGGIDVDRGGELYASVTLGHRAHMGVADATGSDEEGTIGFQRSEVRRISADRRW
jgi:hypothetical protein